MELDVVGLSNALTGSTVFAKDLAEQIINKAILVHSFGFGFCALSFILGIVHWRKLDKAVDNIQILFFGFYLTVFIAGIYNLISLIGIVFWPNIYLANTIAGMLSQAPK